MLELPAFLKWLKMLILHCLSSLFSERYRFEGQHVHAVISGGRWIASQIFRSLV